MNGKRNRSLGPPTTSLKTTKKCRGILSTKQEGKELKNDFRSFYFSSNFLHLKIISDVDLLPYVIWKKNIFVSYPF
jgi:hypothetical protein